MNYQMFKLDLQKAEGPKTKLPTLLDYRKQLENSTKTSASASLTMLKPLIAYITTNWKILKETEIQTTIPAFCETCMQVKKQQLEPDMKKWTSSKLGMEYIKAVYCHPAYLTYMQSTS